jgi:hypothetical protein
MFDITVLASRQIGRFLDGEGLGLPPLLGCLGERAGMEYVRYRQSRDHCIWKALGRRACLGRQLGNIGYNWYSRLGFSELPAAARARVFLRTMVSLITN